MSNDNELYWSQRYIDNSTGWDLGGISRPIKEYVDQLQDKQQKILIPGAGNAYEAEYLYRSGFSNVYIIDISPLPLRSFEKRVPSFPKDQIIEGDFFEMRDEFDLIIEQTFFCSFPPIHGIREKYVAKTHELLSDNGKLVGVWFDIPLTDDMTKRPFGGSKEEYMALFSTHYEITVLERAYNSVSDRMGQELFGILKKRKQDL
ncbi:MAG: methyltransferase domain-containing protein [Aureisphaera sp.]